MRRQPRSVLRKRRFMDLNQPGAVFVKVIGLLLVLFPLALSAAGLLTSEGSRLRALAWSGMRWSLAAGALLLVVLLTLVVIEQVQDHHFDAQYRQQRDQKLPLSDGYYECQHCGNRRVRASDTMCRACGSEFRE